MANGDPLRITPRLISTLSHVDRNHIVSGYTRCRKIRDNNAGQLDALFTCSRKTHGSSEGSPMSADLPLPDVDLRVGAILRICFVASDVSSRVRRFLALVCMTRPVPPT